jgi:hypothetical protein
MQLFDLIGIWLGVSLALVIRRAVMRSLGYPTYESREVSQDELINELPDKPKNDHNLTLLEQPEKPKRMFVRLGDDGELVEYGGEHETNSQV